MGGPYIQPIKVSEALGEEGGWGRTVKINNTTFA